MLRFGSENNIKPKIHINIGALFDVPTASIMTGSRGESIMNGGLGQITGIVGHGNNYKSTIMHYMMLSACDKIMATTPSGMTTYDTEVNISIDRLTNLASGFENLPFDPIVGDTPVWSVTDKATEAANKWAIGLNKYADDKVKGNKYVVDYTAFKDPFTKGVLKVQTPTFCEIDSLSEFEATSTIDMLSNDLDDSSTNTFAMKQGLFKTKFLSQLPSLANSANIFFLLSAQIGEKINMETGPMAKYNQPTKKLQYLKQGDAIKGVSSKFFFLLNSAWYAHTATLLNNQTTKMPEYPMSSEDTLNTDLNVVKLTQMRSKNGPSGYTLEIVVSQTDGVLPTLTEFHYIKSMDRFGLEGTLVHYSLTLLPEVKLSRGTVRRKIDDDPKLRRAINITSELLQFHKFHPHLRNQGLLCTPKELHDDLIALGYDWDVLLNTRGYWLVDNYNPNHLPFLSTIDLMKMRKGLYKPYFLEENRKVA